MKNLNLKHIFLEKNILYFILISYCMYMFGFYFFSELIPVSVNFKQGYILGNDSTRYIRGANEIMNLEMPNGKVKGYMGYVFLIVIFKYFNLDLNFVVLFQIFITFLSSLCIYQISKKFFTPWVSVLILSLYLFYLPLQMWNFYILTETIFICTSIFLIYFFVFFKKKFIPLLFFLILYYVSLKPHGFILIPSLISSALVWLYINKNFKLFYFLIIFCVFLFFPILLLLNFYLENEKIVSSIVNRGIIWGYDNENNALKIDINSETGNKFSSLLILIKNNFFTFSLAFFKKIWFFYLRVRPYYSDFHNIYIIIFNLIYLPSAFYGFFKFKHKNNIGIILMYSLTIFYTLSVGLTWADWDGRFSLYILPMVLIFAGAGYKKIFNLNKN